MLEWPRKTMMILALLFILFVVRVEAVVVNGFHIAGQVGTQPALGSNAALKFSYSLGQQQQGRIVPTSLPGWFWIVRRRRWH